MASRGRGRRGRARGTGQAPPTFDQSPVFDQLAFAEAVGVAAAAIAHASIAGSQGGPSNLQRYSRGPSQVFTRYFTSPCSGSILQIQLMWWIGDRLRLTLMGLLRRDLYVFWIAVIRFCDVRP